MVAVRSLRTAPRLPEVSKLGTRPPQESFAAVGLPPVLVALVGLILAAWLYRLFLSTAEGLWCSPLHDRNAHLWFGISLAIDFRTLDLPHFLKDLHSARIWGPLHPLLVGIVLAVGGLRENLAVLPSLASWVGSAVFAFLAARRAVPRSPSGRGLSAGNLAGFVAALFVLASPAFRAFATDIMLESLGACLSLGVLYFYLRVCQERTPGSAAGLGLMLTLLFFHKYNYWLLILLPLIAASLLPRFPDLASQALVRVHHFPLRSWLRDQLRQPLTWVLAVLGLVLLLPLFAGNVVRIAGREISLRSSQNVVSVMVWVLFLRLWPWWRNHGRGLTAELGVPGQQLIYWHVWPVVLWFLWPQRLSHCLTYLTRSHGLGEDARHGLLGGLPYYWSCLSDHYHAASWLPYLVAGLALAALLLSQHLRPGSALIFWILLLAGGMTMAHPTLRSRFLHSWIAVLWVAAGVGLVQLLQLRWLAGRPALRHGLKVSLAALLIGAQIQSLGQAGRSPEGGPVNGQPMVLDLMRPVLAELDDSRQVVILSNNPLKFMAGWTYLQHSGRHGRLETDLRGFGPDPDQNRPAFERWLQTTRCDAVVFIDLPPDTSPEQCDLFPLYNHIPEWMGQQQVFRQVERWPFPQHGNAAVTLWKRSGG